MTDLSKEFRRGQTVFVVDPDLKEPTVAEARYFRAEKETGAHLVTLNGEEDAARRIEDNQIAACRSGLNIRLGL